LPGSTSTTQLDLAERQQQLRLLVAEQRRAQGVVRLVQPPGVEIGLGQHLERGDARRLRREHAAEQGDDVHRPPRGQQAARLEQRLQRRGRRPRGGLRRRPQRPHAAVQLERLARAPEALQGVGLDVEHVGELVGRCGGLERVDARQERLDGRVVRRLREALADLRQRVWCVRRRRRRRRRRGGGEPGLDARDQLEEVGGVEVRDQLELRVVLESLGDRVLGFRAASHVEESDREPHPDFGPLARVGLVVGRGRVQLGGPLELGVAESLVRLGEGALGPR
jgi:hypothetical protein